MHPEDLAFFTTDQLIDELVRRSSVTVVVTLETATPDDGGEANEHIVRRRFEGDYWRAAGLATDMARRILNDAAGNSVRSDEQGEDA